MAESLNFVESSPDTSTTVGNFSLSTADRFQTRNQFYGLQLGGRAEARWSGFFVNLTGKVALGTMHEMQNINGNGTVVVNTATGPVPAEFAGGIFAQNSNSGPHSQSQFAAVPEVITQIGWQPWSWLRLHVGYNFLYISNVIRPGQQIDQTLNPNNFASNFLLVGAPIATAFTTPFRPAPVFNTSSFFAHGINVGVEFRF